MFRAIAIAAILCTTPALAQPTVPSVDIAVQYRMAIKGADSKDPRSIEKAVKAIEGAVLGKKTVLLPELAALLVRPVDKHLIAAQIAAANAIPKLGADTKAAVDALVPIVDRRIPSGMPEVVQLYVALAGASVNALGELQDPRAFVPTLRLLYRAPQLAMQVRRAVVAYGPTVVDELRKVLRGQHAEVNALIKAEKLDQYCVGNGCQPVSLRAFYAAILAGDLRDPSLAEDLFKLIKSPSEPAYVIDGNPGPTQHAAAFEALRQLGVASTAPTLLAMIRDPKTPLEDRTQAAAIYAFVSPDAKGIAELGKIAADNTADDNLRQACASSFARLATTPADSKVMEGLAQRYLDASAKKTEEAKKQKEPAIIKNSQVAATGYLGFARMFQAHMARIEIGGLCKTDQRCYAELLAKGSAFVVGRIKPMIKDVDTWSAQDKEDLWVAALDRALIDISKRGTLKPEVLDKLLAHAGSTERVLRQGILIALGKAAPRPCPACVTKLDAVIEADRTKSLGDLTVETQLVRNYLRWAK